MRTSGPALRQWASHHAIHNAAWHEASDALAAAEKAHQLSDSEAFSRIVEVFLEVVDIRILIHAREEESDLYQEWLEAQLMSSAEMNALIQDHDTLRQLTADIEQAMIAGREQEVMSRMHRLLDRGASHSQHEEAILRWSTEGRRVER